MYVCHNHALMNCHNMRVGNVLGNGTITFSVGKHGMINIALNIHSVLKRTMFTMVNEHVLIAHTKYVIVTARTQCLHY